MDVTLPNGKVISGVPDGTTKDVIMQKAISAGLATQEDFGMQQQPAVAEQQQSVIEQPETQESNIGQDIIGGLETAATIASGAIAEPLAGIRGIYEQVTGGDATKAIEETREALTYEGGKESKQQLKSIGETLAPVGEALSYAETYLGESVLGATGSPALAAAAHTLPTAALELLGLKSASKIKAKPSLPSKRQIKQAVIESAPEVDAIKNASRSIYKEIDDSGATIKPEAINKLVNTIEVKTRRKGLDPRVTAQASGALDALKDIKNTPQPITELDIQREIAGKVAGLKDSGEAMLGNIIIDEIDDFMDSMTPKDMTKGSADIGKKYKSARKLWGRAKRSEMINDAVKLGERRAAGAEAGIRNEIGNLLNRKGSSKYIPADERAIMEDLVKGDFAQNMTRLIGKTGLSIDRSPNVFQSIIAGGGLGSYFGGGVGALAVPAVGTVSKAIAQKLTRNKASFLDSVVRSGTDANKISKAYLKAVPKNKRNTQDLADLLSDPKLNLDELEMIANKTFQDAVNLAKGRRDVVLAAGLLTGSATSEANRPQETQE